MVAIHCLEIIKLKNCLNVTRKFLNLNHRFTQKFGKILSQTRLLNLIFMYIYNESNFAHIVNKFSCHPQCKLKVVFNNHNNIGDN